jgi:type III secretion protein J
MASRWIRAGALALGLVALAGCNTVELHSGMSESEAQEILVLLQQNGITATKAVVGEGKEAEWTVTVPAPDASHALQILEENDLPQSEPKGFEELFGKSKLIPTETEEKAMFLRAMSGELEKTLRSMPRVIAARVHISIPKNDPLRQYRLGEEPPRATAAVFMKLGPGKTTEMIRDEEIQRLVASSVEGLRPDDVTVVQKEMKPEMAPAKDPIKVVLGIVMDYALAPLCAILALFAIIFALKNRSLSQKLAEQTAANAVAAGEEPAGGRRSA